MGTYPDTQPRIQPRSRPGTTPITTAVRAILAHLLVRPERLHLMGSHCRNSVRLQTQQTQQVRGDMKVAGQKGKAPNREGRSSTLVEQLLSTSKCNRSTPSSNKPASHTSTTNATASSLKPHESKAATCNPPIRPHPREARRSAV